jgi:hypothetical protein
MSTEERRMKRGLRLLGALRCRLAASGTAAIAHPIAPAVQAPARQRDRE